jgi:hypothetical protein
MIKPLAHSRASWALFSLLFALLGPYLPGLNGLNAASQRDPHFIAATARLLDSRKLEVKGTTNLPSGSVVNVAVFTPDERVISSGWATVKERSFTVTLEPTTLEKNDKGEISSVPDPKKRFDKTQIVDVIFGTYLHKQPPSVLSEVGERGEKMRGVQVRPDSTGEYKYLAARGIGIQ